MTDNFDKTTSVHIKLEKLLNDISNYLSEQNYANMDSIEIEEHKRLYKECNDLLHDLTIYDVVRSTKSPVSLFIDTDKLYVFPGDERSFDTTRGTYYLGDNHTWKGSEILDLFDHSMIKSAYMSGGILEVKPD